VSGNGISWATCKSAPRSRQTTTPVPHRSVFYRPDARPAAQPTASKHWRLALAIFLAFRFFFLQKTNPDCPTVCWTDNLPTHITTCIRMSSSPYPTFSPLHQLFLLHFSTYSCFSIYPFLKMTVNFIGNKNKLTVKEMHNNSGMWIASEPWQATLTNRR